MSTTTLTAAAVPMTTCTRRDMVTMPRGRTDDGRPGFAARCEKCGAITFGGYPSRTASREAIRHGSPLAAPAVVEWCESVLAGAR